MTIYEVEIEEASEDATMVEVKTFKLTHDHSDAREEEEKLEFHQPFWARATIETRVKLGGLNDYVLALVDHSSEINIMSRELYEKGKWPFDTDHSWIM